MPDADRETDGDHSCVCSKCLGHDLRPYLQEITRILIRIEQGKNGGDGADTPDRRITHPLTRTDEKSGQEELWMRLTGREKQVMESLMTGASNRIIAKRMGLSERTIKNHLQSAYRKLRVHSRAEAILKMLDQTGQRPAPAPPGPNEPGGSLPSTPGGN